MLNTILTLLASPAGQQLLEVGGQELVQVFALLIKKHGAIALTTPAAAPAPVVHDAPSGPKVVD